MLDTFGAQLNEDALIYHPRQFASAHIWEEQHEYEQQYQGHEGFPVDPHYDRGTLQTEGYQVDEVIPYEYNPSPYNYNYD